MWPKERNCWVASARANGGVHGDGHLTVAEVECQVGLRAQWSVELRLSVTHIFPMQSRCFKLHGRSSLTLSVYHCDFNSNVIAVDVQLLKLCSNLCDPLDCSTSGSSVLHYLPEFAHIHSMTNTSNHLIVCCSLLLLPSIFPSIRAFPMDCFITSGVQSSGASP